MKTQKFPPDYSDTFQMKLMKNCLQTINKNEAWGYGENSKMMMKIFLKNSHKFQTIQSNK